MTHFMQSFDQVVAFYCEHYAAKSAEKQKRETAKAQPEATPLQFHMEPMEVDQNTSSNSSTTTTTTTTTTTSPMNRAFEEELVAVETTLTWYELVGG